MTDSAPPALPPVIITPRLRLPLWDAATVAAVRTGGRLPGWHPDFPRPDDVSAASLWRDGDCWGPRSVVSQRNETVMGSIGFFGAPEPAVDGVAEVEVGFGLVQPARGHGAIGEALAHLLPLVDSARVRVRAAVAPDNAASLRVVAKAGFTTLRGTTDDDELIMVRPLA